jgi:hypothetical protein
MAVKTKVSSRSRKPKLWRPAIEIDIGSFFPFFYLCVFGLLVNLILGGAAGPGFLSDFFVQILSVPLLIAALWRIGEAPLTPEMRWTLVFCAVIVFLSLAQLIPLPPTIWTKLPGRANLVEGLGLLGRELPFAPLAISPRSAWLSTLSIVPPLSIFLGALTLGYQERRALTIVVIVIAGVSVFIGLLQIVEGLASPLWFSDTQSANEAQGFYFNRNHFAALLYCAIPLAVAWGTCGAEAGPARPRNLDFWTIAGYLASFTAIVILIAGVLIARSRAGAVLASLALFGAFALAHRSQPTAKASARLNRIIAGGVLLAVLFSLQFIIYRLFERFEADPLADARFALAVTTFETAKSFLPFGAGQGSFVPAHAIFEKAQDILPNVYVNHAHNELPQLLLESGIIGVALLGGFSAWLIAAALRVWRRDNREGSMTDRALARAASLIIILLALHSFVDFPLRTSALMAVFALACAMLIPALRNPVGDFPRT